MSRDIDGEWVRCAACDSTGAVEGPGGREPCSRCQGRGEIFEHDDGYDDGVCLTCNGDGYIVTCCDDICVGRGECIRGDGEEMCPDCQGGLA